MYTLPAIAAVTLLYIVWNVRAWIRLNRPTYGPTHVAKNHSDPGRTRQTHPLAPDRGR